MVGFTGTRHSMTPEQKAAFEAELRVLAPGAVFHHGACVGADEEAVFLVRKVAAEQSSPTGVTAHPGPKTRWDSQAARDASAPCLARKDYRPRNTDIVAACDVLCAAPPCRPIPSRGGTRMTVNIAVSRGVPVVVFWPDGEVEVPPPGTF